MKRQNTLFLLISIFCFTVAAIMACTDDNATMPSINDMEEALIDIPGTDSLENRLTEKYGVPMYFYAQVNKRGDYFRRMFIDITALQAILTTSEIPGNALIAMETWFGESNPSTVFFRTKRAGEWLSGSFSPSAPDFGSARSINSCNNCHNTAQATDFTFTQPLIARSIQENAVQFIECDMGPTGPCDLATYLGQ
ncbi:MAG: cytochrome P460 family protein [Cytophagales bacterium]|nr:cytochrome P460 family protein [Cytophagales bacterium]